MSKSNSVLVAVVVDTEGADIKLSRAGKGESQARCCLSPPV